MGNRMAEARSKKSEAAASVLAPAEIKAMFERFEAAVPDPSGELDHVNPYTLLVAVVLSAQATDKGVNKATKPLFEKVRTPQAMLALGQEGVEEHIRTVNLWRNKAKAVIGLSRILVEEHGGEVPRDREALERLPGVGHKSASVVLNQAFGIPEIAVDTHVFRVSNRTGLAPGKTPIAVERLLGRVVPERFRAKAHIWLILHGRYVCTARRPDCPNCLIKDICRYPDKTPPATEARGESR